VTRIKHGLDEVPLMGVGNPACSTPEEDLLRLCNMTLTRASLKEPNNDSPAPRAPVDNALYRSSLRSVRERLFCAQTAL
jgi:hypothetical protein